MDRGGEFMTYCRINNHIATLLLASARLAFLALPVGMAMIGPQGRAQSPVVTAGFEVASIRLDTAGGDRRSLVFNPDGITYTNVTLRDCIRSAYAIKDYQISAASPLSNERYDIIAKAAGLASEDQLRLMLQRLLADRFR